MTDLTLQERQDIRALLKEVYDGNADYYKERVKEHTLTGGSPNRPNELLNAAQEVAKSEYLLDQFNTVTTSKLAKADRLDIQKHLQKEKDHLIKAYREQLSKLPLPAYVAAEDIVKLDNLLKNFNEVTHRLLVQANLNSTGNKPSVPPFGGCR